MATALFTMPSQPLHALPTPAAHPQDPPTAHHPQEHGAHAPRAPAAHEDAGVGAGVGVDLGSFTGRRITLKPRRTLSLSPTPARTGDMSMGRNLRAARCLDFTDKDDDDGLYQPSDSDTDAAKKKGEPEDEENNNTNTIGSLLKGRHKRHTVNGIIGGTLASALGTSTSSGGGVPRLKTSVSVKRPLDVVLPCQEIQYLDISYQKVGTVMVQYSPIPRKKIAYHHVPYNSIPYCEVPYCGTGERPIKRKPLQRSHSIAVADRREPEDFEWTSYKLRDVLGTRISSRTFKERWDGAERTVPDALIFSSAEASV